MTDNINGTTVYVCQLQHPPRSGHYGATGEWEVMGAVVVEDDADEWVQEDPDRRRYVAATVGMVGSY